jgi:hypothetical protein
MALYSRSPLGAETTVSTTSAGSAPAGVCVVSRRLETVVLLVVADRATKIRGGAQRRLAAGGPPLPLRPAAKMNYVPRWEDSY